MPAQKVMQVEAVQSLIAMQADIYNRGDNFNIAFTNGHNPVLARISLMRHAALQEGVDYVLWLDSDHIYKGSHVYDLIDKMEKNDIEALSAAYKVRGPCDTFAHGRFLEDGTFKQYEQKDCEGIVDCDVLGFGFYLMKHSFVKEMVDRFGIDLFAMNYRDDTTEDVYFCRKMKEAGKRICFDSDIIVGHLMTIVNK